MFPFLFQSSILILLKSDHQEETEKHLNELQNLLNTNVLPSPGTGAVYTDPFTGEIYVDDDPGLGDGRLDDCGGVITS